jgi:hypothetical protein
MPLNSSSSSKPFLIILFEIIKIYAVMNRDMRKHIFLKLKGKLVCPELPMAFMATIGHSSYTFVHNLFSNVYQFYTLSAKRLESK